MKKKDSIEALLLDMDGVLYVGSEEIPGAQNTIHRLRAAGIPFRFITNTTTRTPSDLRKKLEGIGLEVEEKDLFTAITATRQFLENQGQPSVHLLVRDQVRGEFASFSEDLEKPDFIVIGDIGARWDYETLNDAFRMLLRGSRLICMHRNKFFEVEDGLRMDIGAFVAALEYVADTRATVLGKPDPSFFKEAVQSLGCSKEKTAMVGDDIDTDIGGGQECGLTGILVQTGKYRKAYCDRSPVKPDFTIPSIANLPELLAL